ncbi:hypothetical protein TOTORO_01920 [Serratia phage vB_SmaS-Totoro]|nr:hypothetical protein TOTORO_01920 [Serratia phage vB_SmaS-Totoro]
MAGKSRLRRRENNRLNSNGKLPIKPPAPFNHEDLDDISSKTISRLKRRIRLIY